MNVSPYLLTPLPGHKKLEQIFESVRYFFSLLHGGINGSTKRTNSISYSKKWESLEKGHGRIETRKCATLSAKGLPSQDEGLATIVRISRERKEGEKIDNATTYYITSIGQELIANSVRKHWQVENSLHWRLDVVFGQDQSRDRNGARNLATCRKVALNLLQKETTLKRGIATKQATAIANPLYREKVIKNLFEFPMPWDQGDGHLNLKAY